MTEQKEEPKRTAIGAEALRAYLDDPSDTNLSAARIALSESENAQDSMTREALSAKLISADRRAKQNDRENDRLLREHGDARRILRDIARMIHAGQFERPMRDDPTHPLITTERDRVTGRLKRDIERFGELGSVPISYLHGFAAWVHSGRGYSNVGCDWCNGSESSHETGCPKETP